MEVGTHNKMQRLMETPVQNCFPDWDNGSLNNDMRMLVNRQRSLGKMNVKALVAGERFLRPEFRCAGRKALLCYLLICFIFAWQIVLFYPIALSLKGNLPPSGYQIIYISQIIPSFFKSTLENHLKFPVFFCVSGRRSS